MTQINKITNERGDSITDTTERQKNIDYDEPLYTNQIVQPRRNG